MHAQLITYRLRDLSRAEFEQMCAELAPLIATQCGLISKVWLEKPEADTYGGMYLWRDRGAMERFLGGDLVRSFAAHPGVMDLASQDFAVADAPTRVTSDLAGTRP